MKSGILALVSISSALVSCTSYERPPLFDQITGKNSGNVQTGRLSVRSGHHLRRQHGPASGSPSGPGILGPAGGHPGEKHIIIDLKQQKVFYYVGTTLVGVSPMSSGKEGYGTPRGTYKIIQKDANYKSGTYGVLRSKSTGAVVNGDYNARAGGAPAGTYFDPAPMPYWMRITGGYGMHVGFVTGYPVSHGCVRLPEDMAKTFFEHTPIGTKVTIR